MNLKTTVTLGALVLVGAAGWLLFQLLRGGESQSETVTTLEQRLTPDEINRIEISRGDQHVVLEKVNGAGALPGNWPVREPEVQRLVATLGNLRTRFAVMPLGTPPELKKYGLEDPLRITVRASDQTYKLDFGYEPAGKGNRFSRPTYVRLDEGPEVVRLAPGLVPLLDHRQEYFMQRRLFPVERVAKTKDEGAPEKVEKVAAREIRVDGEKADYTLARASEDWELRKPVADRPDPERLEKILTGLPDIWVESFVDAKKEDFGALGLKEPLQHITVVPARGGPITLQIGSAFKKVRKVRELVPSPIPQLPPREMEKTVQDEYRHAKLKDYGQIFDIKADRLKDLFIPLEELRDPKLTRFRTDDAKRLEMKEGGRDLVFARDKDGWRMEKPASVAAESFKVTELLDKLAGLQARDADVIDKADPKTYGLDHAVQIKLTLEEGKDKKVRELAFLLGKHDTEKKKLYVEVAGQQRINAVDDELDKLVKRPALAYRNRRVLDLKETEMARIDVHRGGDTFALEQVKSAWRLATPVQADVDSSKADSLVREVSHLDAAEFITDAPKKEDLAKVYGLAEPALTIKVSLTDAKKLAPTLLVGIGRRAGASLSRRYYGIGRSRAGNQHCSPTSRRFSTIPITRLSLKSAAKT